MRTLRTTAVFGLIAWLAWSASARAQVIDDFYGAQAMITGTGSSTRDGGMLGGERDVSVTASAGAISASASLGAFTIAGDAGAAGDVTLVWDGNDNDALTVADPGLAANLASGGDNALLLGINSLSGSPTITLTVYSGAVSASVPVPGLSASTLPQLVRVAYSAFAGIDFSAVRAIKLQASGLVNATIAIDFLRTGSTDAPTPLEATLTDVLLDDVDGNGRASAGDKIRYVVRIRNTASPGGTVLNNLAFNAAAPGNTVLGEVTAKPLAQDDGPASTTTAPGAAFHTAFNTALSGPSGNTPSLLANDFAGLPAGTISQFGGGTLGGTVDSNNAGATVSSNGHSLTVNANGSFTYTPKTGFTGLFTFEYRLSNTQGTAIANVTIAVGARPNASDDSYAATGNVQMSQNAANGVINKATADAGDALGVTGYGPNLAGVGAYSPGAAGFTLNNGNLTVNADGSFTYNPPPGFTGSDSFVYRVDNGFNQPDTATVTIAVSGLIWFINNAGSNGDGRLTSPFNSVANFNAGAADDPGDIVFVYQGTGNYSGSIALLNNQQLIGQGVDLAAVTGITVPAGSLPLPVAASNPTLVNAGTIVTLPGSSGVSVIRGLTLNPTSGSAISGSGSGTTTIANVSLNPTGSGAGLSLTSLAGAVTATSCPVTANSTGAALAISGGNQAISFDSSSTFSQSGAGRLLDIQSRAGGTVTVAGNLSATGSSAGLLAQNNTGGAITFSGGTKSFNTGANTAVTLANNTGATIDFSGGGLTIVTSSGTAFTATGGGTVSVAGSGNTIDATSGPGLNVNATTISASGLTFQRISSGAGANVGIALVNTGNSGGLTVTGDGSNTSVGGNSTGGVIAGKSGSDGSTTAGIGIYLNNTLNVALRRMTINGVNQNYGIKGLSVNGFTMEYCTVGGTCGTAATLAAPENYGEGAVYFGNATANGLAGTVTLTSNNISGGRARNLSIVNTAPGTTTLVVKGSTFGSTQNFSDGNASVAVEARASSGVVINTTFGGTLAGDGNTLTGAAGDLVNFTGQQNTTMDVALRNNTLSNNHAQNNIGGGSLTLASAGTMTFQVTGNTMRDAHGSAVTFFKASALSGTPSLSGSFNGNTIGVAGTAGSGSMTGNGIYVSAGGTGSMAFTIANNQIHQIGGNAHIYADNTGGSYTANFTITGNTLDTPLAPNWFAGIAVTDGSPGSADTVNVCAKIGGVTGAEKNFLNLGGNLGVIVGASGAGGGHTFNLPGLATFTEGGVEAFLAANNSGSFTVDAYADAPATFAAFTGAGTSCSTP